MTKDEVLKLMAKAIEDGWSFDRIDAEVYPAIKEALAQPEQEADLAATGKPPKHIPESWATHGGLWIEALYKHQRGEK